MFLFIAPLLLCPVIHPPLADHHPVTYSPPAKLSITTFRTFPLLPPAARRFPTVYQQIIALAVRRGKVVQSVRVCERQLLVFLPIEERREATHAGHPFTAIKSAFKPISFEFPIPAANQSINNDLSLPHLIGLSDREETGERARSPFSD